MHVSDATFGRSRDARTWILSLGLEGDSVEEVRR